MIARILDWILDRWAPIPHLPDDMLADLEAEFESWEPRVSGGRSESAPGKEAAGPPPPSGAGGLTPTDEVLIDRLVEDYRAYLISCFTK